MSAHHCAQHGQSPTRSRATPLGSPERSKTEQTPLGYGAIRWPVAVGDRDLGVLGGLPQNRRRDYCSRCQAVQEGHLPLGRPAPPPRPGQGGAGPHLIPTRIRVVYCSPTCLAGPPCSGLVSRSRRSLRDRRATPPAEHPSPPTARQRRGVPARWSERPTVAARGPRAATVLPVGDLPRSGSPSDDPAAQRHHRGEVLTWNGETLTLNEWSQRTGIRVKTLLQRCRKGWTVEQVLTTPPGPDE
jgi:hypothetical protein